MDVRDPEIMLILEDFTLQIHETIEAQELELPRDYDLVLSLEKRWLTGGYNRIYYFADHTSQSLFWVQECDSVNDLELGDLLTLTTPYDLSEPLDCILYYMGSITHSILLGLELQSRYWSVTAHRSHNHISTLSF